MPKISTLKRLHTFLAITAAFLGSSCSTPISNEEISAPPQDSWWSTVPVSGNPKIVISLSAQRVALFKGDQLVGISPISSGREEHGTRVGNFSISEKDENHRSSLYGAYVDASGNVVVEDVDVRKTPKPPGTRFLGADMHWFMRVNGAIGMHRGYLPGYPASHGCIRLPGAMASLFFHATPHGTPVEIRRDASLIALQPRFAPSLAVTENTSNSPKKVSASKAYQAKPAKSKSTRPGATLYWDGIQ